MDGLDVPPAMLRSSTRPLRSICDCVSSSRWRRTDLLSNLNKVMPFQAVEGKECAYSCDWFYRHRELSTPKLSLVATGHQSGEQYSGPESFNVMDSWLAELNRPGGCG
jgi:hypothetical protein